MNKNIEELQNEKADLEKQIDQLTHKNARIDNRIRYLTKGERNKRTHHLCSRMGFIEHCIPELKDLTEAEFCALFEYLLSQPEVQNMIDKAITSHYHRAGKGDE